MPLIYNNFHLLSNPSDYLFYVTIIMIQFNEHFTTMYTENLNRNVCIANKWTEALLDVSVDTTQILIHQIR